MGHQEWRGRCRRARFLFEGWQGLGKRRRPPVVPICSPTLFPSGSQQKCVRRRGSKNPDGVAEGRANRRRDQGIIEKKRQKLQKKKKKALGGSPQVVGVKLV